MWDTIFIDHDLESYYDECDDIGWRSLCNTGSFFAEDILSRNVKYNRCITHSCNSFGAREITKKLKGCIALPIYTFMDYQDYIGCNIDTVFPKIELKLIVE